MADISPSSSLGFSAEELATLRSDTPATAHRLHFNNAGSSLPPSRVNAAVKRYLDEEERMGGYAMEAAQDAAIRDFYLRTGRLLHADPDEIAFLGSATIAWRIAFNGLRWQEGDEILTTDYEYGSNLIAFIQAKQLHGVQTRVVPASPDHGQLLRDLKAAITPKTRLIAIPHIPSSAGYVHPAAEIGALAREHGLIYFLDACQSVGHLPVHVDAIGCDILSATGRKYLRGPRGTGFLYVRKGFMDQISPIHLDLVSAEQTAAFSYELKPSAKRFETFENSRALQMGLSEAVVYALDLGMGRIWHRIQAVAKALREGLAGVPGVEVKDEGALLSGIVTFAVDGKDHREVARELLAQQINVSVTGTGSTYHYMTRIGHPSLVRASVHAYNSFEEVDRFCGALRGMM